MNTQTPIVDLPQFEGPLELLLFLIKKEEINIYDIPIAYITNRYLQALEHYSNLNLEVGGDFLLMASTLMYIKSRMLLPRDPYEEVDEEGEDPRSQLVRQLLEFQMFQEASESLRGRDLLGVDTFHNSVLPENEKLLELPVEDQELAAIPLYELIKKFKKVIDKARENVHFISAEEVPLRKCIQIIVERMEETEVLTFNELIANRWSLRELIVYFLAVLELCKLKYIYIRQAEPFGPFVLQRNPNVQELDMSQLSWI